MIEQSTTKMLTTTRAAALPLLMLCLAAIAASGGRTADQTAPPGSFTFSLRSRDQRMAVVSYARMDPADAARIPWDPDGYDWLEYWLDVHLPGLAKWVYPNLEDEFGVKTRKKGAASHTSRLISAHTTRSVVSHSAGAASVLPVPKQMTSASRTSCPHKNSGR